MFSTNFFVLVLIRVSLFSLQNWLGLLTTLQFCIGESYRNCLPKFLFLSLRVYCLLVICLLLWIAACL